LALTTRRCAQRIEITRNVFSAAATVDRFWWPSGRLMTGRLPRRIKLPLGDTLGILQASRLRNRSDQRVEVLGGDGGAGPPLLVPRRNGRNSIVCALQDPVG
jgi:hypothetical protein